MTNQDTDLKLDEWYEKHSEELYRFVHFLIGDHEQAKDIVQDTFLKAYIHFISFKGETSEKNWLFQIARNSAIDHQRRKKTLYFMDHILRKAAEQPTPEQIAILGEDEERLYTAIKKLNRPTQEAIYFRKIKELSIKETAEILKWKESKVKSVLHRGLKKLKSTLEEDGYETKQHLG